MESNKKKLLVKIQNPLNTPRNRSSLLKANRRIDSELVLAHLNFQNFCRHLTNEQLQLAIDTYVTRAPAASQG